MDVVISDETLLDQRQAAAFLGVVEATLERWRFARTGIPYIKCGRLVRYKKTEILRYLDQRTVKVDAQTK